MEEKSMPAEGSTEHLLRLMSQLPTRELRDAGSDAVKHVAIVIRGLELDQKPDPPKPAVVVIRKEIKTGRTEFDAGEGYRPCYSMDVTIKDAGMASEKTVGTQIFILGSDDSAF